MLIKKHSPIYLPCKSVMSKHNSKKTEMQVQTAAEHFHFLLLEQAYVARHSDYTMTTYIH